MDTTTFWVSFLIPVLRGSTVLCELVVSCIAGILFHPHTSYCTEIQYLKYRCHHIVGIFSNTRAAGLYRCVSLLLLTLRVYFFLPAMFGCSCPHVATNFCSTEVQQTSACAAAQLRF